MHNANLTAYIEAALVLHDAEREYALARFAMREAARNPYTLTGLRGVPVQTLRALLRALGVSPSARLSKEALAWMVLEHTATNPATWQS